MSSNALVDIVLSPELSFESLRSVYEEAARCVLMDPRVYHAFLISKGDQLTVAKVASDISEQLRQDSTRKELPNPTSPHDSFKPQSIITCYLEASSTMSYSSLMETSGKLKQVRPHMVPIILDPSDLIAKNSRGTRPASIYHLDLEYLLSTLHQSNS